MALEEESEPERDCGALGGVEGWKGALGGLLVVFGRGWAFGTNADEVEAVEALAGDDGYELGFAEEGDFGGT